MSDYKALRDQLAATPYLVADGATATTRLTDEAEALRLMDEAGLFHSQCVMNAARALEGFTTLAGKADRTFTLPEIASVAGVQYHVAYAWMADEGVLTASERAASGKGKGKEPLFSYRDAFVAGICGSLRRQGLKLEVLRQAARLFDEKKRTARRGSVAKRS